MERENGRLEPSSVQEIESCHSLFLLDLREPRNNSLVILVGESSLHPPSDDEALPVPGAQRIVHTELDRVFEISWDAYVAYSVVNESFGIYSDEPGRVGRLFVRFATSRFLDYVSETTWDDKRSQRRHWQINCENHTIDVVSTEDPIISRRFSAARRGAHEHHG